MLDRVHEALYQHGPFNSQYVVDDEHESLIFAVGSEVIYHDLDDKRGHCFYSLAASLCLQFMFVVRHVSILSRKSTLR
jgi:hypothetical protein